MALPEAVERAGQLADKLYAEAYGTPAEPAAQSAPPNEPAPLAAPPAVPAAPASPAPAPVQDSWEARYKVLTGKYNAEVPRLAADNRTLKETVGTLSDKVSTLTKQVEDAQSRVPAQPLIKPEEIQEFGEPLVDMSRRAGREEAAQAVAPVQRELTEVRNEVTNLRKSAAQIQWQNFIDLVTAIVPNWAQINANEDFLQWMGGTDDLSGMTRQDMLEDAKRAHDAPRTARFFQSWVAANQTKATDSRNALEPHVVPDSSSRTVVPEGKQVLTRRQIAAAYDGYRAGRISDAEWIVMEAEIDAATREGRIR